MKENLRNMTITTGKGKDVHNTSQLDGEAKPTKAWKEKNSTVQHKVEAPPKGDLGGKNTNS